METSENKGHKRLPISKTELALLYSPNTTPGNALKILRKWICEDAELKEELEKTHYSKNGHLLKPIQVSIFYKYWGRPDF